MKRLLIIPLLVACSSFVNAAWTGAHKIKVLKAQSNGVYVVLNGFTNTQLPECEGRNSFFMYFRDGEDHETRVSFLLAAKMADKPVSFSFYECTSNHLKLGSVQFN